MIKSRLSLLIKRLPCSAADPPALCLGPAGGTLFVTVVGFTSLVFRHIALPLLTLMRGGKKANTQAQVLLGLLGTVSICHFWGVNWPA